MNVIHPVPGSFRDPSGRVYQSDGRIFRTVTESFSAEFDFVNSSGLLKQLAEKEWVLPAEKVNRDVLGSIGTYAKYVLEVPILHFVSYPYEWPFGALKAAALLHLEIHLAALEYGVTLSDASAYNVQFEGARPVFIDHLSFRRYRNGEIWAGHRQFCDQFLTPLLLRAFFSVPHNAWYRGTQEGISGTELKRFLKWRHYFNWNVVVHIVMQSIFQQSAQRKPLELKQANLSGALLPLSSFRRMLEKLHGWISKLEPADTGKTVWRDYAKKNSYSSEEVKQKKQFVLAFVRQIKPKLLWDLGSNIGDYSIVGLEGGADYVVGFDFDLGALEAGFARSREDNLPLQMLFLDAANPSPDQGWMVQERQSLQARASAEGVLALAFVHHLAIARNIPFGQLLDWIVNLAPTGVIEFVPKTDPMVEELLRLRADIFPEYTREFFLDRIARSAQIVKSETVSASGRLLVWYARR